jgi:hypothetical protein
MILDFDWFKNRELEWNVKDKDTGCREMDRGCAVLDAGYRAEEFSPQISQIARITLINLRAMRNL